MPLTCRVAIAIVAASFASPVWAQESDLSVIECTGEATVGAVPDIVDFDLVCVATAATVYEAARSLTLTEESLSAYFDALKPAEGAPATAAPVAPAEVAVSGVVFPDVNRPVAQRSARLRYSIDTLRPAHERAARVASVCDAVREAAAALQCTPKGPFLKVRDEKQYVQSAILRAAENAYTAGEGAASALTSQIAGVVKLKVDSVLWDFDREWRSAPSDVDRITCKVKVSITYSHGFVP